MNADDMIRANLERITRERSGDRSLLGFPVIERDALEDELTRRFHESFARESENDDELRGAIENQVELDALRLERKIANDARRAALSPEAREVEDL